MAAVDSAGISESRGGASEPKNMAWQKGQTGNPNGRPAAPEREALRRAIANVEKRRKKKFLIHCVEQAFEDNNMAKEILKKIMPDMKEIQGVMEIETVEDKLKRLFQKRSETKKD